MAADDFGCGAGGDRRRRWSTPTRRSCLCCGRCLFEEESGRGFAEMAADDFGCGGGVAVVGRAFVAAGGEPLFNDGCKINLVQRGHVERVEHDGVKGFVVEPRALLGLDEIYVRSY